MCSGSKQKKLKFFLLYPIHQKPVGLHMALPKSGIFSCQVMVTILSIQFLTACQDVYNCSQHIKIQPSLPGKFQIFFKTV